MDAVLETRKRSPHRVSPRRRPAGLSPAGPRARPRDTGDAPEWTVEHLRGSVSDLLQLDEPAREVSRLARICAVDRPGLVLGSAQKADITDEHRTASASIEVVRRRSGGGAVLMWPGSQVWADFFVAPTDPLWHDDVTLASGWVGRLWSSVVAEFVTAPCSVHAGRLVADRWGTLVCFASKGPGEVSVDGRKVVGVSQRRTRDRVRIQTAARLRPDARHSAPTLAGGVLDELGLLDLSPADRAEGRTVLANRCGAILASEAELTRALVRALQDSG